MVRRFQRNIHLKSPLGVGDQFHNLYCSTCLPLVLDEFDQHFQASVNFLLTSAVDKSQQRRNKCSGMPRIKPGATGWEVRMLPLC